jgi:hypothetical protein
LYLLGTVRHNDHMRESGFLAGEAMADSFAVGTVMKYAFGRERPDTGSGTGEFFKGGNSFPSDHAILAWSAASVIAHEYPGVLTQIATYGLAGAISASRVTARKHFPSDVVIASGLGWAIGRQVYRAHHNAELGGADIGTFEPERRTPPQASEFIPLDSWIYPAVLRLHALGYAPTAFLDARPWTRIELARILDETADQIHEENESVNSQAEALFERLNESLQQRSENEISLDSVYVRTVGISGRPLRDGYHFAQTLAYDFGRPYGEGINTYAGVTGHAQSGRYSFFMRAEFQHAEPGPVPSSDERAAVAQANAVSSGKDPNLFAEPLVPFPGVDRGRIVEAYGSIALGKWQVSVGKQSMWWGPARSGSFMMSDNPEPILMARLVNPEPYKLPSLLGFLGPVHSEYFFGRLDGQRLISPDFVTPVSPVKQPFIEGTKISFKPTPNLEMSFSTTAVFAGSAFPLTTRSWLRALLSFNNQTGPNDPGDRRAGFDFSYRLPGLRKWALLYADSMAEDESTPVLFPRRSAINPGLYFAQIPGVPKMDLRLEGFYTDLPGLRDPGFFYSNLRYRSGYTEYGNIIGNVIGRQGSGEQAWAGYWLRPATRLELGFRASHTDKAFLQGGSQQQVKLQGSHEWKEHWGVEMFTEWERWNYPVVSAFAQRDVSVGMQLTFRPKR